MTLLQGKTLNIQPGPVMFLLGEGQTHHPVPPSISAAWGGKVRGR